MPDKAKLPVVSVVTISYNQAEFLERALTSVLNQKDVSIEYIVIDAGSSDESRDIIERFRPHLSQVILERDNGPADGLNRGLTKATGKYFYYLNSDDEVADGAFSEAVSIFEQDHDLDVIYGNGVIIDRHGRYVRPAYSSSTMNADLYARGLSTIVQQATFFRTEALRKAGGFNELNSTCWDGEAALDIALAGGRFKKVWRWWGFFRIYEGSISGSGRFEQAYSADLNRLREKVFPKPMTKAFRLGTTLRYLYTRSIDWRRHLDQAFCLLGRNQASTLANRNRVRPIHLQLLLGSPTPSTLDLLQPNA